MDMIFMRRRHACYHPQVKLTKIIDLIDNNDEQNVRNCDVTMPIQFDNGEWDAMSTAGDYLLIVCLFFRVFYLFCLLFSSKIPIYIHAHEPIAPMRSLRLGLVLSFVHLHNTIKYLNSFVVGSFIEG